MGSRTPAHRVTDAKEATTLVQLLRRRASEMPEKVAYTFLTDDQAGTSRLTFGELDRRARSIASRLRGHGASGQRVLLLYPPSLDFVAAFFGCLYAGAVAVPAYPPRQNRSLLRLRSIVEDAQAAIALTSAVPSQTAAGAGEEVAFESLRWLTTECLAGESADEWREPEINGETLAFLQYTSGSTSTPRGVMVSHENLLANERMIQQAFGQTEHSVICGWLPLYHDMGLIGNVLQPLYLGASCVLMSPAAFLQKPYRWLRAISDFRATTSGAPNFAYELCVGRVSAEERADLDLSSWSTAFNGAEPVRQETMDRFADAFAPCGFRRQAFYPCYGLAEATLLVACGPGRAPTLLSKEGLKHNEVVAAGVEAGDEATAAVSCGPVSGGQRVMIVDPEQLKVCAPDRVGEIWVAGPNVARGYWNRPEQTEQTFRAYLPETGDVPFLRTGDLGFIKNGELFITGRIKDLIIIRGRNHYPQDIELTAEQSHPALQAGGCAAFSVEARGEERLVVVHELARRVPDPQAAAEAIREAVAREHELQVSAVVLIRKRSLPRTSSGKIQRRACREQFLEGALPAQFEWREDRAASARGRELDFSTAVPADSAEIASRLTALLAARLGMEVGEVDPRQPLIHYGVDSLSAVELAHQIEEKLKILLPSGSLLHDMSIAELVEHAGTQAAADPDPSPVVSTEPAGTGPRLSYGQEGLWFLHQLDPESAAYHVVSAVNVAGRLDVQALRRAFQALVDRHPSLRTNFDSAEGRPFQRVSDAAAVCFRQEDASTWDEAELDERVNEEAYRPFDLRHDPLMRVTLFGRGEAGQTILLAMHHIITDFWSVGILLEELGELYRAETSGSPVRLPRLQIEYVDFARRQSELLAGSEGSRLWSFWQRQLAGELPVLELPSDRPRPTPQTYRGASYPFRLPAALTGELRRLCRDSRTTLYTTLLAAFQVLLRRYTGEEDILVGSPAAGRSRAELGALVGYFANPLVIRGDLSGDPTFDSFLAQMRRRVLAALAHQDYPFALIVERLQPSRDVSRPPLFQVSFVLHREHSPRAKGLSLLALGEGGTKVEVAGLELEAYELSRRISPFDLTLMAAETDDELRAVFEYNADLFDATTIGRMARHFQHLIEQIVADPSQRVGALALLDEGERRQIVEGWNDTSTGLNGELCLQRLFEAQVERTPDSIAVIFEDERLTYRELNTRANFLAHHLRTYGVGPDTLVGICMERSLEMVVSLLAVLKAGGAYVPLEPSYPAERLRFMIEDAGLHLLLTQQHLAERLPRHGAPSLSVDAEWDLMAGLSDQNPESAVTPDNLAYLIYTSGSTGAPKGVMISHRSICNHMLWMRDAFALSERDRVLQKTPFSFDASVWEFYAPLLVGGRLVIARPWEHANAAYLLEECAREGVTLLQLVPSMLRAVLEEPQLGACEQLRMVFCGGEALAASLVEGFFQRSGAGLCNLYGPTEASIDATSWECRREDEVQTVPIGRPIANTRIYVVDEQAEPVPVGVVGELLIGGLGLARGYAGRADLTAERFIPDGLSGEAGGRLYRTGDLCRYRADGRVEYVGRVDHQVKVRGYRIEPGEVEAALNTHAEVRECVVVAAGVDAARKQLVAYFVGAGGESKADELREYLSARLPEYMIPSLLIELPALPHTPNGKVDRKALPTPDDLPRQSSREYVAPRTPVEEILCGIWAEVLGVERVGIRDNFFALGGHSLLATQVISRVRDVLGREVGVRLLFERASVGELAAALAGGAVGEADGEPIGRREPEGVEGAALSYAQQRLWFLEQLEPGGAAYNMPAAVRLRGQLDVEALGRAFERLLSRHEVLRSGFVVVEGELRQQAQEVGAVALRVVDVSGLEREEREEAVRAHAAAEAGRGFDLGRAPLVRVSVVREGELEHVLVVVMHHIVSDGWSAGVMVREVTRLYEEERGGEAAGLGELEIQYADYAAWQRERLAGGALDGQLDYWRSRLDGAPPVLELPLDFPRPLVQSFRGGKQSLRLSPTLGRQLRSYSRKQGATLYMTLLTAFNILLQRYSGQEDIVVGAPVAGRERKEVEHLIGCFINNLVLRTDLSGDPSFGQLLERVRETCLGAYQNQELPFEKLVEELQPERSLSHTPLFQVYFNMLNMPETAIELPGLTVEKVTGDEAAGSKFDLTLYVKEQGDGILLTLVYNKALFGQPRMAILLGQFEHLLSQIADSPEERISTYTLVSPGTEQLLPSATQPIPSRWEVPIFTHFARQAQRWPEKLAVRDRAEDWTYQELDERSNRLAHYLIARGVPHEGVVVIYGHRSAALVWGLLGILKAGAMFVVLDPAYPEERLISYLKASRVTGFLQIGAAGELPPRLEEAVDGVSPYCRLSLGRKAGAGSAPSADGHAAQGRAGWETDEVLSDFPATDPCVAVGKDTLAYISFTSGSTGKPKGILGRHQSLPLFGKWIEEKFGIDESARFSMLSGLSHDPLHRDVFSTLQLGASLFIPDPQEMGQPGWLARWLEREQISAINLTPAMSQLLTEGVPREMLGRLTSLRYAFYVGDALTRGDVAHLRRLAPAVTCVNLYGATETQRAVSFHVVVSGQGEEAPEREMSGTAGREVLPVGRGIKDVQLLVLNGNDQLAGVGEVGEVCFRSPHLARGYLGDSALTREKFIVNPLTGAAHDRLYRSGDLGRYLPDGGVALMGRKDSQVQIRGFRLEPGEVEAVLSRHAAVNTCAVIAREDTPGEKRLVGYVVPQEGESPTAGELRGFLRRHLPEFMVPSGFINLPALPLTPNGKLDRRALPAPERAGDGGEYAAPRTPIEERLAGIWENLLGRRVGIHDNFFELGGHSLLATRAISHLWDATGVQLSVRTFFESPTIADLAVAVVRQQAAQAQDCEIEELINGLEQLDEDELRALLAAGGGPETSLLDRLPALNARQHAAPLSTAVETEIT